MAIYTFQLAPTDSSFQVPFTLTEKALMQWLNSLENKLESTKPSQILLSVIQAINREEHLSATKKSLFFTRIFIALPFFIQTLHSTILTSTLPLSAEEQSNIQNIVWVYAELANGFANCKTKKSNQANAQTLFYGLQSSIIAYIHISQAYQQPFSNFWKQSYLFFGLACKLKIQDLRIEQHPSQSDTISKAFKHLMALYHCGLEQFRPRDIIAISNCIEKYTSLMLIDKTISNSNASRFSAFDLNSDAAPTAITRLTKSEQNAFRFFSAYSAAIKICKNAPQETSGTGVLKSINQENIIQAAKTLSFSQKRKYTRLNEQKRISGIIGLKNIINELAKTSSLTPAATTTTGMKTDNHDSEETGSWKVPDLELVVEGYESLDAMKITLDQTSSLSDKQVQINQAKHLFSATNNLRDQENNIWTGKHNTDQQTKTSIKNSELGISDSSIKGYKIIFDTHDNLVRVQIGDTIGIKNNTSIEIGIIHRIVQLTEQKLELGINLIALESEIAYLSLPKSESVYAWVLFLPGKALNLTDSVIFNDSQFQCGEFVNLHRTEQNTASYRLSKLLHLSNAATHIELFHSNIMNEK